MGNNTACVDPSNPWPIDRDVPADDLAAESLGDHSNGGESGFRGHVFTNANDRRFGAPTVKGHCTKSGDPAQVFVVGVALMSFRPRISTRRPALRRKRATGSRPMSQPARRITS